MRAAGSQARLGSRKRIEGKRKADVQGRTAGIAAVAGIAFAFRPIILSVVAAVSVLQSVAALSLLMVRLLHLTAGCTVRVDLSVR
jgi:hypothetical protein